MPYCLLKNPLWMSLFFLGLFLASAIFLGYGFSSILLTSILTLSNLIFNFSKHKQLPRPPLDNLSLQSEDQESTNSPSKEASIEEIQKSENEHNDQNKEDEGGDGQSKIIMLSESESQGRSSTSEDSEADYWKGNIFGSPDSSDGSISDEDSLIEISLPSGVYIDHYNEELEEEKKKKLGDSFFKQKTSLVELLAELNEMNEEDNLIEIDLSMGSIKCPRFEIYA